MKVSIITSVYNQDMHLESCIKSVLSQTYPDIEYILVDGASTDNTIDIINKYRTSITKFVTEKDSGIYEALNKGIKLATGEIIGILHSDDLYANENVIKNVVDVFKNRNVDSLYGDLIYVNRKNQNTIIRYWKSGAFDFNKIKNGWMPPHPTFFVKRNIYEKYGHFNTDFKISADYEIILRFFYAYKISSYYIPEILVKMRTGGISNKSFSNILKKSFEDYHACKTYGLETRFSAIILKNIKKLPQFFIRS